jgi:cytochrome c-type biogenesis protein CcmH/NrfF
MRAELAQLVTDGKSEQEIVDYYLAKYGSQEPLAEPIDRGFNRLAWAVPYLLGAGGLAFVGTIAVKWSRRRDAQEARPVVAGERVADAELESRLDDELRDLD